MSENSQSGNNISRKKPAGHGAGGEDNDDRPVVTKSTSKTTGSTGTSYSRGKASKDKTPLAAIPEQPKEIKKPEEGRASTGKVTQPETKESSPPKITKDRVEVTLKRVDEVVKVYDNGIKELKDKIDGLVADAKALRAKQKKWEGRRSDIGPISFIFETNEGKNSPTEREQKTIEKGYGSIEKDLDDVAKELDLTIIAQYQ